MMKYCDLSIKRFQLVKTEYKTEPYNAKVTIFILKLRVF